MSAASVKDDNMKKTIIFVTAVLISAISMFSCSDNGSSVFSETEAVTQAPSETATEAATTEETTEQVTAPQQKVGYDGMTAVGADGINDGEYDISVDSSSTMFKITECRLNVSDGKMTAEMIMSGTGYEYLYMGTGDDAQKADEADYIKSEDSDGKVKFTVPVEALDKEIDCAAFSKRKQQWYDRKLVFRADSLPVEALADGALKKVEDIGITDGEYTVDVILEGGSGKASVQSPAKLTVKDGKATAEIIWSSNKYDYMIVDGEKILPSSTEEFSVFDIPVAYFDYKLSVSADTTAMSTPHEISYTLYFDFSSIK